MAVVVEQMTWVAKQTRWVKKLTARNVPPEYRKQHWVSPRQLQDLYPDLVRSLSREGSRQAANQYWHDLQSKTRRTAVEPSWKELASKKDLSKKELRVFNDLLLQRLQPARQLVRQLSLPDHDHKTKAAVGRIRPSLTNAALADELPLQPVESESKFSHWRDKWLTYKRSEVKPSSYASLPIHLARFRATCWERHRRWRDQRGNIGIVPTASGWTGQAGKISQTYAKNVCNATVKPFVRYLAKHRKVSLPNNLEDLGFATVKKKPVPIPLEVARRLLSESEGRLGAWLLLMFNCAYYQSDLADLKPSEVDWKAGRITRKRSKEKDEENVPEVCYRLWPETFQALKQWGSTKGERVFTDGRKAADTGAIRYRGEGVCQTAEEAGRRRSETQADSQDHHQHPERQYGLWSLRAVLRWLVPDGRGRHKLLGSSPTRSWTRCPSTCGNSCSAKLCRRRCPKTAQRRQPEQGRLAGRPDRRHPVRQVGFGDDQNSRGRNLGGGDPAELPANESSLSPICIAPEGL